MSIKDRLIELNQFIKDTKQYIKLSGKLSGKNYRELLKKVKYYEMKRKRYLNLLKQGQEEINE